MAAPSNTVSKDGVGSVNADQLNTYTQQCATVVAARAFTGTVGMGLWLQGTTAFNDGGQGAFGWNPTSTAADDGGASVIAPTGSTVGRWIRQATGAGTGAFTNVTVSSTLTINTNTKFTSDGSTVTLAGALTTTGLTTASDLAVSGSKTASNVLAAPTGSSGTPTWRQLSNSDISGLGTMATQAASNVNISGGVIGGSTLIQTTQPISCATLTATLGLVTGVHNAAPGQLLMYDSTATSYVTVLLGSFGANRTYTLPDQLASATFLLSSNAIGTNGLFGPLLVPLASVKNADGTGLAASPAAGKFGMSLTAGTSLFLLSETANSSTVTDSFSLEYTLPPTYLASQVFSLIVNGNYNLGSGTVGTHTLQISMYSLGNDGTMALVQSVTHPVPAAAADIIFVLGSISAPNARVLFVGQMIIQDTGGHAITGQINSIRLA